MVSMKQLVLEVRPKLVECIVSPAAQESDPGANGGVTRAVVSRGTPGVRNEVTARDCNEAGIGQGIFAIAILRHKGHLDGVAEPMAKGRAFIPDVTWILTPDGAEPGFHGVTQRVARNTHAQALPIALPMWTIDLWAVENCVPSSAKEFTDQSLRTNSSAHHPVDTLFSGDGLPRGAAAGGIRLERRGRRSAAGIGISRGS